MGGWDDGDFVSPALLELVRPAFGLSSLDAFEGFQAGGFTPKTGEYSFRLVLGEFLSLLALASCTFDARLNRRGLIKMTVSQTLLRAQAYDYAVFSETVLPLDGHATGVTNEQPISFTVPSDDLEIAGKAVNNTVTFTFRPEQARVELVAGNFERPLVTRSVESFKDFDEATIGVLDPSSRRAIDLQLVRTAIDYVAPAAIEDQTRAHFDLIEFGAGRLVGGDPGAIAIFTAAGLNGLDMRIRYRFINSVRTVLAHLEGQVALFETADFYIIRDRETAFGFEKSHASFPDITPMLSPHSVR
ncbi:MAG: hypothetical protein H0W86_10940, partial [Armatimonadetes bacterium]|nr:hypothetical protein [Armatimonadota bacterium]